MSTTKIGIVGAGLAGLTVAYQLMKRGIPTTIIESSDRIGGRILTRQFDSTIYELGAEFIDSNHSDLIKLIKELDIDLLNAGPRQAHPVKFQMEPPYEPHQIGSDYQKILPTIISHRKLIWPDDQFNRFNEHAIKFDQIDMATYIDDICKCLPTTQMAHTLKMIYAVETGVEPSKQSCLNLILMMGFNDLFTVNFFGPSDECYKVVGGTNVIVEKLVKKLIESGMCKIILGEPVKKIAFDGSCQIIGMSNTYTFDNVVMTLPFQSYGSIDYEDVNFSSDKLNVIQNAKLGHCAKVVFKFKRKFWTDTIYIQYTDIYAQIYGDDVLVVYLGGEFARNFSVDHLDKIYELLHHVYPLFDPENIIDMDYFNWSTNIGGAYSIYRVGQSAGYNSFAGLEGNTESNYMFAGEGCDIEFQGYMNGAVLSANRCVDELIKIIIPPIKN